MSVCGQVAWAAVRVHAGTDLRCQVKAFLCAAVCFLISLCSQSSPGSVLHFIQRVVNRIRACERLLNSTPGPVCQTGFPAPPVPSLSLQPLHPLFAAAHYGTAFIPVFHSPLSTVLLNPAFTPGRFPQSRDVPELAVYQERLCVAVVSQCIFMAKIARERWEGRGWEERREGGSGREHAGGFSHWPRTGTGV